MKAEAGEAVGQQRQIIVGLDVVLDDVGHAPYLVGHPQVQPLREPFVRALRQAGERAVVAQVGLVGLAPVAREGVAHPLILVGLRVPDLVPELEVVVPELLRKVQVRPEANTLRVVPLEGVEVRRAGAVEEGPLLPLAKRGIFVAQRETHLPVGLHGPLGHQCAFPGSTEQVIVREPDLRGRAAGLSLDADACRFLVLLHKFNVGNKAFVVSGRFQRVADVLEDAHPIPFLQSSDISHQEILHGGGTL
mmetsp:Transcript_36493/g.61000  ORF Transcript_36493/g.61000 Transcript_36493/m.61000 type:complete len:248 (-) Transcript_36493:209-952(-)